MPEPLMGERYYTYLGLVHDRAGDHSLDPEATAAELNRLDAKVAELLVKVDELKNQGGLSREDKGRLREAWLRRRDASDPTSLEWIEAREALVTVIESITDSALGKRGEEPKYITAIECRESDIDPFDAVESAIDERRRERIDDANDAIERCVEVVKGFSPYSNTCITSAELVEQLRALKTEGREGE